METGNWERGLLLKRNFGMFKQDSGTKLNSIRFIAFPETDKFCLFVLVNKK